jgi:hypothetical protein
MRVSLDVVGGRRKTKARGDTWVRHYYSLSLVHSSDLVGSTWSQYAPVAIHRALADQPPP